MRACHPCTPNFAVPMMKSSSAFPHPGHGPSSSSSSCGNAHPFSIVIDRPSAVPPLHEGPFEGLWRHLARSGASSSILVYRSFTAINENKSSTMGMVPRLRTGRTGAAAAACCGSHGRKLSLCSSMWMRIDRSTKFAPNVPSVMRNPPPSSLHCCKWKD